MSQRQRERIVMSFLTLSPRHTVNDSCHRRVMTSILPSPTCSPSPVSPPATPASVPSANTVKHALHNACSLTSFKFLFTYHFISEALPGHPIENNMKLPMCHPRPHIIFFQTAHAHCYSMFIWSFIVHKLHKGRDLELPSRQQCSVYVSGVLNKLFVEQMHRRGVPLDGGRRVLKGPHGRRMAFGLVCKEKYDFYREKREGKGLQVKRIARPKAKWRETAG